MRKPTRRARLSVARILLASILALAALLGTAYCLITQPGFSKSRLPDGPRAEADRLRRHVEFLTKTVHPRDFRHVDNLDSAAAYVRARFEEAGAEVSEQPYVAEGRSFRNVIARFGPEGRPFVVGAHYDAFGGLPGADDNASGTAGLLELARILGARRLAKPVELVAYSTEEPPFFGGEGMGSAVHAKTARDAEGMISLEMIGYFSDAQPAPNFLLRLFYPSRGDFALVAGRYGDRKLMRRVMAGIRGEGRSIRVRGYAGPTGLGSDLSDHRCYWAEGVPAVMVTDTAFVRNRRYHTAEDTAETLDYERMAEVVDGVGAFLITEAASRSASRNP